MSINGTTRGVCAACRYQPGCNLGTDASRPVLECAQFELAVSSGSDGEKAQAGLCASCENRETCIYPRPEGGVWRCEEYA